MDSKSSAPSDPSDPSDKETAPGNASQKSDVRVVMSAPTPHVSSAEPQRPFAGAAKGATQRMLAANTPLTHATPGRCLCPLLCKSLAVLLAGMLCDKYLEN